MKDSPARGNAPVIGQERSGETVGRRSGAPYVVGAAVLLAAVGLASGPWLRQRSSLASSARSVAAAPVIAFMPATTRDDSAFSARTRTEVGEWHDVSIASQGGAEGRGTGTASIDAFRAVAAGSGSTLVILPTVAAVGDSTRYSLAVYDFQSPRLTYIVRVRPSASALDAGTMREMIAHALVGPAADSAPGLAGLPVASLSAARGYVSAWRMVRAGAFDSARAAFAAAASGAPAFAQAHLWAAQTGAWLSPKDASGWRDDARRSIASPTALRGTDSLLASALVALAAGDPPGACDRYRAAIAREPDSFVAWYGLGQCQHVDRAVVRDARVPGGLRFRSSHWSAVAAYSEALARLPASGMSSLFVRVVNITYSSGNQLRAGVSLPPDTVRYVAFPSLSGDTVQTLPVPSARIARMDRGTLPETFSRALQRGRQALLEFTRTWITRAPAAADGWFQRAYALELAGAFDAPDAASSAAKALERANSLNADPVVRARIDVARTRVAVRRGEFDAALRMARGSLARPKALSPAVAVLQAPLAAFVGDVGATTSLLRTAATATDAADRNRLPPWVANSLTPWLADSLRAFGVRAMLGVCDGLQARKDQIEEAFIQHVPASDLAERRSSLLREVYRAAVPCLGPAVLRGLSPQIPLDHAIAALDARDPARARSFMRELDQTRSGMSASTLTEDAVLAETWVWLQTGDSARARAQLRANVNDWASISNFTFDEIAQAAALARVRAMVATP